MDIKICNLNKSYVTGTQTVNVLKNFDLSINAGGFLAIMGPSGTGKSSLLHLIGGIDRPDSGDVVIGGEKLNLLSEANITKWRARHIGLVFQFYHLLPMLNAEQNVALPLLLTPLTRSQRKHAVEVALDLVGLTGRQKHKPRELSGGEQQRVAIARAIVGDPAILVCDEPTGDLDRKNASEIVELLSLLNKHHGKTIVLATHDPKVAESAQQILVLEKERDGFNSQGQRHDFS